MTDPKAPHDLTEEVGLLRRAVDELSGLFRKILKRTEDAEKSITRSETAISRTWKLVVFDLALTLALVVGGVLFNNTQHEIQKSIKNQCGMLALFIGSYRPETRPPEAREEYENAFRFMRDSYRELECTVPIVPPATSVPTAPPAPK